MCKLRRILCLFVVFSAVSIAAHADNFNVIFYSEPSTSSPVVGTGTFSFDNNLGDGTYALSSLTNYNIDFTVGSSTFTDAGIANPISEILVVIYGGGSQFYFSNTNAYGTGPYGGSIDFTNIDGSDLTTEPPGYGAPPLDLYQATDSSENSYFGMYDTSSVIPEPSGLLLLGTGLMGLVSVVRRKFAN
jgi:hypothetical protein